MAIRYEELEHAIGLNWYELDPNLAFQVRRLIEGEDRAWVEEKLHRMGGLIGGVVAANAEETDRNPAVLRRWDREGDEINAVDHPRSALDTKRLLWRENFLHLRYSDDVRSRGRAIPTPLLVAYQYLLCQAETGMLCSIGMTTGVLRLVERYGDEATRDLFLSKLTLNDFDQGWDGSMYLTERAGGSDLGTTETVATFREGAWKLDGFKWFCSNVDGDAIVTLARPEGAPAGIRGLALFAVPRRLPDGRTNGVHIRRIKEKLGTRAVPTGEIDFVDATACLLAGPDGDAHDGRGINRMMEFVTESRIGVAAMGAGIMRRVFFEAMIRASRRRAFGRALREHGMVREQLIDLMVESEAAAAMLFELARRHTADYEPRLEDDGVARILVPLTKIRCTRGGIMSASAALEVFGGNGYIEDWPMARQLRDAQCHTIWEGTENVLSLDVLRSLAKSNAGEHVLSFVGDIAVRCAGTPLEVLASSLDRCRDEVAKRLAEMARATPEIAQLRARRLAGSLADILQAALVLEEGRWALEHEHDAHKAVVAAWFVRRHLVAGGEWSTANERVALELFDALVAYERIAPDHTVRAGVLGGA